MKRLLPFALRSFVLLPTTFLAAGGHLDRLTDDDWCDHDCGSDVTRTYSESDFDGIECHSAFHLTVRQSDAFRVVVTVPKNAEHDIDVRRDGKRLRLSLSHGFLDGEARGVVELPVLRRIEAHDASNVRLERITSPGSVEVQVRSASELEGDLAANRTIVDLGAASSATLTGTTDELRVDASGVSNAHLRGLSSRRADVELSSASTATIRVSEWLDVKASELSVLHYYGGPGLGRVDLSSGARIEHEH